MSCPLLLLLLCHDGAGESAVVSVHVVTALVEQPDPDTVAVFQIDNGGVTSASVSVVRTRVHPGNLFVVDDDGRLHFRVVAGQDGGVENIRSGNWCGELAWKVKGRN